MARFFRIRRIYTSEDGGSKFGTLIIPLESSGEIGTLSQLVPGAGVYFRETPVSTPTSTAVLIYLKFYHPRGFIVYFAVVYACFAYS